MNYIFFPLFINLISPNYSLIINIYFCLQNSQETRKQLASNSQATRKQLASNPVMTATYPPGVLTGRPMEMFEVAPNLDLYAVPEQWAVGNKDTENLKELSDALEGAHEDLYTAQMGGLVEQLDSVFTSDRLISRLDWTDIDQLERFSAPANYSSYLDQLMEVDAELFPGKEIADALQQFEEDFDYEEFLRMNNIEEVDMEMEDALDVLDQARQGEMDWIEEQLIHLERFQDKSAYYMYPMVWDGGVIVLHDFFSSFGIKEALQQFEEDFDYEESLVQEKLKNTEVNFHRLLATPPSSRPGWCGNDGGNLLPHEFFEQGDPSKVWIIENEYHKERYRFEAKVIHDYPSDRKGYALAETVYGKIYIPEKFRGYIPPTTIDVTVALQDVGHKTNGKTNSFRFTAIYLH